MVGSWKEWLASLILHGMAVGASVGLLSHTSPPLDEGPVPLYFEIIEAAADPVAPAAEPPPESPVPPQTEPDSGPVPLEPGPVPIPEEGSVPLEPDETAPAERVEEHVVAEWEEEERAKVVSEPLALNRIVPVYPRSARRKGHEGCVTVAVSVAEDGDIVQTAVVASSGHDELDAAALAAVRSARFAPATADGVRVRGELRLTFDFRLR